MSKDYPLPVEDADGGAVRRYVVCPCCGSTLWQAAFVDGVDERKPVVARDYRFSGRRPGVRPGQRGGGGNIRIVREYGPRELPAWHLDRIVQVLRHALVRAAKVMDCLPTREVEHIIREYVTPGYVRVRLEKLRDELRYWRQQAECAGTFSHKGPVYKVRSRHVRRLESLSTRIDFDNPWKRVESREVKRLPDVVNEDWCSK